MIGGVVSLILYHVSRLMSGGSQLVVYGFITAWTVACFLHGRGVGHGGCLLFGSDLWGDSLVPCKYPTPHQPLTNGFYLHLLDVVFLFVSGQVCVAQISVSLLIFLFACSIDF